MASDSVAVGGLLLSAGSFCAPDALDADVLTGPGLYAIRLNDVAALPAPFFALANRVDRILYVGKATVSLRERFLEQELRAKGHGTFFRSIGAVLGYRPVPGSLVGKANQHNFVFAPSDRLAIRNWLTQNVVANAIAVDHDLGRLEIDVIRHYTPLLNLDHNPAALQELIDARRACLSVARGLHGT